VLAPGDEVAKVIADPPPFNLYNLRLSVFFKMILNGLFWNGGGGIDKRYQ
jgi:hypothetical protein